MKKYKEKLQIGFGLILFGLLIWVLYWSVSSVLRWFLDLPPILAVGMLTASSTIIVATITVVLGKYFERVKEAEVHLRAKKIEIYDDFLQVLFSMMSGKYRDGQDLIAYMQEFQRKLVIWCGPKVLNSFLVWKHGLTSNADRADNMLLMDEFLRTIRNDIGLSNKGLNKGFYAKLILNNSPLFMSELKKNPDLTFSEFSVIESKYEIS